MKLKSLLSSDLILFFIVLVFSLLFRVSFLNMIEFKQDEALNLLFAAQPLFGNGFMPGGTVSSIGILNFPLLNYLLFPFVFISFDPRFISFVIGLINSLSIAFLFVIFSRYFGRIVSFFACIFLALSPWSILFSRKIWIQDFIIPFAVLFIFSVLRTYEKGGKFWTFLFFTSLLLIQIHQTLLLFVAPVILTLIVIKRSQFSFTYSIIGILLGIIPLLHFFIFQIQNGCPDCQAFVASFGKLAHPRDASYILRPFQITGFGSSYFLMGESVLPFSQQYNIAYSLRKLFYLQYILVAFGGFYFLVRENRFRFLFGSALLLPVFYFILQIEPQIHYYIVLLPFLFLFSSYLLFYRFRQRQKIFQFISIGLVFVLSFSYIFFTYSLFSFISENNGLSGDYGEAYSLKRARIAEQTSHLAGHSDYEEIKLSAYISPHSFWGYRQDSKMLYDFGVIQANLSMLENQIKSNPEDRRSYQKVFAYHTQRLNNHSITQLRDKSRHHDFYRRMYDTAYERYLQRFHLQSKYVSSFGLYIEIPEHYSFNERDSYFEFQGDKMSVVVIRLTKDDFDLPSETDTREISIDDSHYSISECFQESWCGSSIHNYKIGDEFYSIEIIPSEKVSQSEYFARLATVRRSIESIHY